MSKTRLGFLSVAVLALVASACSPSASTPTPSGAAATTAAPTQISVASGSAAATTAATPTPSPTPTAPQKPPAPTNFTVTYHSVLIPCPSPNAANNCHMSDLAWQSTALSGTWFKIYEAWTGEGGATCQDAQADELVAITTAPNARTAQVFEEIATGGGARCMWITAVNSVGESAQVPAVGQ